VTERENIIRRWVRLKQASKLVREVDIAPDGAVAAAARTEAETTDDAPFDLASLPSIESIAADTDIVEFLRAEVPTELTRAALRRAWNSDPAIRDFIGIAENQWDFNDPDAIPGFGPMTAMESSANALAQISSGLDEVIAEVTSPGEPAPSQAARSEKDISSDEMPEAGPEQSENRQLEDYHVPGKRRRHGGALPQ
jgi:hypothetical protein